MTTCTDLLITDGDMTLDAGGQPVLAHGRACVAQDILHMILETGLLEHFNFEIIHTDKMLWPC